MADNILNARIRLKYDTWSNWTRNVGGSQFWSTFIPLKGEVCVFSIPQLQTSAGLTPPAIGMKVGDGQTTLEVLPWISAKGGDVPGWAKKSEGEATDIIATRKDSTDPTDETKWTHPTVEAWLQSLTDDINSASGASGSVSTQIANAIANLTASDIPDLPASKITSGVDTTVTSGSDNLITSGAVATAISELTGVMHFKGSTASIITDGGTETVTINSTTLVPQAGDVVLSADKEFVWTGTNWELLGDESSYALNTISITGNNGLTGGGTLTQNITISHAVPTGAQNGTLGTSGGNQYIQTLTTDSYGHVIGATYGTDANTTYTLTWNSSLEKLTLTPNSGNAQTVDMKLISTTADIYDLENTNDTQFPIDGGATGKYFIWDCGDASHLID